MKHYAFLALLAAVLLAGCSKNSDLEDYEKYEVLNSSQFKSSSLTPKTSFVEVCPYLSLGTADTISYKENLKVCIEEVELHTTTDGKEKISLAAIDARYGDTADLVFWDDIPAGVSHHPAGVLADTISYHYSWACDVVAEIRYKVRMRDNKSATGWSEWENKEKSKICFPDKETQVIRIQVPLSMKSIQFDAIVAGTETTESSF